MDGDYRYQDSIWAAIDGISIVNSVKNYSPDADSIIDIYEFTYYYNDSKKYQAIIDNTSKSKITDIEIVSISSGASTTISEDDITAFHKKQEEAQKEQDEAEQAALIASFDTGITYDQLARTPSNYEGEKVKFTGTVIQVVEDSGFTQLRIAVNDDYSDTLLVNYISSIISSRVLEDDSVTVRGVSEGLYTYTSVLGSEITIPSVSASIIEINY